MRQGWSSPPLREAAATQSPVAERKSRLQGEAAEPAPPQETRGTMAWKGESFEPTRARPL